MFNFKRAAFCQGRRLLPDAPLKLEDFMERIRPLGERFLFLGDGMPVHRQAIAENLGDQAAFTPPHLTYLRPSAAGQIALERPDPVDYLHLEATYLRPPNAQKNRKLLEAMAHE